MNTHTIRVLTECDTMLTETAQRYALARRRLAEVEPGFSAHTPGAGEPGGGSGFSVGSSTERLVITGKTDAARREVQHHPELDTAQRVEEGPDVIAANAAWFAAVLDLPMPDTVNSPRRAIQLLTWTRWIVRQFIAAEIEPQTKMLDTLHRSIVNLHRTVTTWGRKPTEPETVTDPTLLADDPTDERCRSCLRVGMISKRIRGFLCDWCYRFHRYEGFLPPPEILEIRASGTVYEHHVKPFRKAFRDRQKKRGKRAS